MCGKTAITQYKTLEWKGVHYTNQPRFPMHLPSPTIILKYYSNCFPITWKLQKKAKGGGKVQNSPATASLLSVSCTIYCGDSFQICICSPLIKCSSPITPPMASIYVDNLASFMDSIYVVHVL